MKANVKIFKTPESSFSTGMVVHFCIFLEYINILGEAVHSQTARQRDDQTDKKKRHFTEPPHYRHVQ